MGEADREKLRENRYFTTRSLAFFALLARARRFLRQKTFAPLCLFTQVYKWVPVTFYWAEGNPALNWHPIQEGGGGGEAILIILSTLCYGNRVKLEPCYQNLKCTGRVTGLLTICYPVSFVMFSSRMPSDCSYSHHSQVSMLSCCKNRESSPSHFVS